jgi:hypothetical protein
MAYALFAGENYYPAGGVDDFVGVFESLIDAHNHAIHQVEFEWGHIVDTATFTKVLVWACVTEGKRATKTRPAQLEVWGWVAP